MIYNGFNREINHGDLWRLPVETCRDPWRPSTDTTHGDLWGPNWSVICLAPATKPVSHSFALPPATKPVSHLPCPLPPNHTWRSMETTCRDPWRPTETTLVSHLSCPCHQTSQSFICLAPCHQTSQSFTLPPATKPPTETCGDHLQRPMETTHRDLQRHLRFDWSIFPTTFKDIIGTDFDWLISPPQPIRSFGLNNLINIKS